MSENLPEIEADEDLILNVFLNLMDNAIKYNGNLKEINIETGLMNNRVYFRISDNGFGISASDQMNIFNKFLELQKEIWHIKQ